MTTTPRSNNKGCLLFFVGCAVGGVAGFGAGVASVKAARETFLAVFQDERSAEVDKPILLDRPAFRLQYPENWKVKPGSHGEEGMFSIESPGQSFVMFVVATGALDPALSVELQAKQQTAKVMRDATSLPFDRWGAYSGTGVLLTGNMLGISPGTLRIFAFRSGERTFTVIESTFDDDRSKVAPGFTLIEQSFKAKDPPP
jgi:hypothetical protein